MAFALVEWKGDPKPDCWQVIKTSQIQGSRDGIKEGNVVDALWKRDEDTSVAEILKLSGRCKFLNMSVNNSMYLFITHVQVKLIMMFAFFFFQTINRIYIPFEKTNLQNPGESNFQPRESLCPKKSTMGTI